MADPPDREELHRIADAEQAKFDNIAVITNAEGVVRGVRIAELVDAQKMAYRRVSAARGRLTRARKDGSAEKIAAAARRLRELEGEADRISHDAITEMQQLTAAALDRTGELLDQMGPTWDARDAVTNSYLTDGAGS